MVFKSDCGQSKLGLIVRKAMDRGEWNIELNLNYKNEPAGSAVLIWQADWDCLEIRLKVDFSLEAALESIATNLEATISYNDGWLN